MTANMHIVHVIVALEVGGAELMLTRLVTGESKAPLRHTVVSLTQLGTIGEQLRARNIEVRVLGMTRRSAVVQGFWRLRRALRELQPDVVHTWMYHADFLGGLAARSLGFRNIIWCIRTTNVKHEASRLTPWLAYACGWLSRFVPKLIVCAAEASRRSHVALGYDEHRMRVINNGFDIATLRSGLGERARVRAEWGLRDDMIVIGAAGRFSPAKDFPNFIRAAAVVAKAVPQARFVLIGRGLTDENAQLKQWIGELGLANHFVLLGERRDMPACLAALDIFCLSSRGEGFPNVVGEAMGAGLPCVVTDVGDTALLLGECGTVVAKEDPEGLGRAMIRMAQLSPEERAAIGAKASLRIETEFSMESVLQKYASCYDSVVSDSQGQG